jgi:D-lactate dehydrogenase
MVMGPSLAAKDTRTVPEVTAALLEKAGLNVVYPAGLRGLCCGQPFMSKGIVTDADAKLVEV